MHVERHVSALVRRICLYFRYLNSDFEVQLFNESIFFLVILHAKNLQNNISEAG